MHREVLKKKLLELKVNGQLPSRDQILDNFRKSSYLFLVLRYFTLLAKTLEYYLLFSKRFNDLKKYPYECVIFSHLLRFKRYTLGLSKLSFMPGPVYLYHCIDCYHPILKSIFELAVENRLAAAYINDFGNNQEIRRNLADRILKYTDYTKKKHNQKFKYFSTNDVIDHDILPNSILEHHKKSKKDVREEIKILATYLNSGDTNIKINHWYPTKDSQNKIIGDPTFSGSMQWRCRDVLAKYAISEAEAKFWQNSFDSIYDLLNRYSHPVLGYDDNLRPEEERLFDLYLILCPFIILFDNFILPGLVHDLKVHMEDSPDLMTVFNEMENLKKEILPHYSIASMAMNLRTG